LRESMSRAFAFGIGNEHDYPTRRMSQAVLPARASFVATPECADVFSPGQPAQHGLPRLDFAVLFLSPATPGVRN
jgi:hypothetical protein